MNRSEALENIRKLTEIELIKNLKLLKENSYGILSKAARAKAIERFKLQIIGKEYYKIFTEEEINVIIEYTLLKCDLRENEHDLRENEHELREHIESKPSKTPERDER